MSNHDSDYAAHIDGFLEACHDWYEREKEPWGLMQAIWVCAVEKRKMPEWVATAYANGYEAVRSGHAESWDAAFGPAHPKGTHLQRLRNRNELMSPVYNRICEIVRDEQAGISDDLFSRVGEEFGIGKTLASEYYYGAKKVLYP